VVGGSSPPTLTKLIEGQWVNSLLAFCFVLKRAKKFARFMKNYFKALLEVSEKDSEMFKGAL
jgi:hypothetical protein